MADGKHSPHHLVSNKIKHVSCQEYPNSIMGPLSIWVPFEGDTDHARARLTL